MNPENPEQSRALFEKIQYREHVLVYKFPHVGIGIDTSGKNQAEYPELLFGTGADTAEDGLNVSMSQPTEVIEGVDMAYITECLRQAAEDSGIHTFWFSPYGEDAREAEGKDRRSAARLRLFKRFWNVTPSPTGFGYLVEV